MRHESVEWWIERAEYAQPMKDYAVRIRRKAAELPIRERTDKSLTGAAFGLDTRDHQVNSAAGNSGEGPPMVCFRKGPDSLPFPPTLRRPSAP